MSSVPFAHHETRAAWRAARNILIVRLDSLGDLLMTTPAMQAIRHSSPQARLTLLGSRSASALAKQHLPMIDEVIPYEAPWVKGSTLGDLTDRRLLTALRRAHHDAAIIFTDAAHTALPAAFMCRLAGIPLRLAHSHEAPHDLLSHWLPAPPPDAPPLHEVVRQLELVRSVGFHAPHERLVLRYAATDVLSMRRKFLAAGGDLRRPHIVVHPGAAPCARRYPAHAFGEAAEIVSRESGCQVIFTGGHDELPLVAQAQTRVSGGGVSLAGKLTLGELAALMAGAQVALCNQGGPAHMAAAVSTSVVVLGTQTLPQHRPWQVRSHHLVHDGIAPPTGSDAHGGPSLAPQTVAEAALDLIDAPPAVWRLPSPPHDAGALVALR